MENVITFQYKSENIKCLGIAHVQDAIMHICVVSHLCSVSYRLVLQPGHVSSEDCLNGQSRRLLLLVELSRHIHPLVLLDDGGCLSATHELDKAVEKEQFILLYMQFEFIPEILLSLNAAKKTKKHNNKNLSPDCFDIKDLCMATHQRAWCPLVNLWMVMAALRLRRYFLRASQQRMVFWMRIHAARSLSALSFSR